MAGDEPIESGARGEGINSSSPPAAVLANGAQAEKSLPQTEDVTNPAEAIFRPLAEDLAARPSLAAGQNHMSVESISQLHVPGEFPRTANHEQARNALGA